MATHNKYLGTGGLDASIRFELDRPEVRAFGRRRSDWLAELTRD